MHLESPEVEISKSQKQIFDFLVSVENFERIIPESIEKFELLDSESFLFQLKGMPVLKLQLKEKEDHSKIILGAKSEKLPFTLTAHIDAVDEQNSKFKLIFEGEFNAMMSMMIKSPIKKFIATLSENIQKI